LKQKEYVNTFRYIFLAFFLTVTAFSSSVGQVPELINDSRFRPDAKAAVDSIYNFNFEGAEEVISPWKKKYPDHPLWILLDGMQFWWQVLSDLEDTSYDEQFYQMMKKANYEAGKLLHRQPDHADGLIIRAIGNGYMARQHANRGDWITSINYGRKAMNAHEYLSEIQPDLDDLKLAEGLKRYYLAHIPEEYPIVKTVSWALPEGDREQGLDLIREASKEAIFASAEASYFLGNINYNYERKYEVAVYEFENLQVRYPQNNYYARVLVKSYYKQQQYNKALNFIEETLQRWENQDLPYQKVMQEELWTWKGRILEKRDEDGKALECYQKAFANSNELPNTESRSFYIVSGFLAGKILYDQQQFEKAKTYLNKVANGNAEPAYRERAQDLLSEIS
jgi:tetratricopeptide (TPR) repeat protein